MTTLDVTRPQPEVALITLNRPEKLNALNPELVEGLHATLDHVDRDDTCRVVVLTGSGRGFCSGWISPRRRPTRSWACRNRACVGRNASRT